MFRWYIWHVNIYPLLPLCLTLHIHSLICVCVCCVYTYIHVYVYIYMCGNACMCICICIYVQSVSIVQLYTKNCSGQFLDGQLRQSSLLDYFNQPLALSCYTKLIISWISWSLPLSLFSQEPLTMPVPMSTGNSLKNMMFFSQDVAWVFWVIQCIVFVCHCLGEQGLLQVVTGLLSW